MISYKDDGWFVTAQHDSSSLFFGNNNLKKNTQNFIQKSEHIRNSTTTIHGCKVSLKVQMEEWARDKVTPGFGKVSIFCAICQYFVQISIFCANVNILCKYQYCVQYASTNWSPEIVPQFIRWDKSSESYQVWWQLFRNCTLETWIGWLHTWKSPWMPSLASRRLRSRWNPAVSIS